MYFVSSKLQKPIEVVLQLILWSRMLEKLFFLVILITQIAKMITKNADSDGFNVGIVDL